MRWVKIDDEVWGKLKEHAEPFIDTENDVIRKILGLSTKYHHDLRNREQSNAITKSGYGLLEKDYRVPILRVLVSMGGQGKFSSILVAVEEIVSDKLTFKDKEPHPSGGPKWRNRAAFERLRMVHEGLLSDNSSRGIWEITNRGRHWLSQHQDHTDKRD